jgi:hypothetical protein
MLQLYSHDTPAALAIQLSVDRGEIAHVECASDHERDQYLVALDLELDDSDDASNGDTHEVWGVTPAGLYARVHLTVAQDEC